MNKRLIKLTAKQKGLSPGFDVYIDPNQIAMIRYSLQDGDPLVHLVDGPSWEVTEGLQEIAKLLEECGIRSLRLQSKYPEEMALVVVEHISSVHYVDEDHSTSIWLASNHLLVQEDCETLVRLIAAVESNNV